MKLCHLCSSIQFERIPPLPDFLRKSGEVYLGPGLCFLEPQTYGFARPNLFGLQYHQGLASLSHSAQTCMLCSLISDEIQRFIDKVHHGERVGNNATFYRGDKPKRYHFQITKRADQDGFIIWTDDGPNERIWYVATFGFGVEEGKQTSTPSRNIYLILTGRLRSSGADI
jgi:hypothetical protein